MDTWLKITKSRAIPSLSLGIGRKADQKLKKKQWGDDYDGGEGKEGKKAHGFFDAVTHMHQHFHMENQKQQKQREKCNTRIQHKKHTAIALHARSTKATSQSTIQQNTLTIILPQVKKNGACTHNTFQ